MLKSKQGVLRSFNVEVISKSQQEAFGEQEAQPNAPCFPGNLLTGVCVCFTVFLSPRRNLYRMDHRSPLIPLQSSGASTLEGVTGSQAVSMASLGSKGQSWGPDGNQPFWKKGWWMGYWLL